MEGRYSNEEIDRYFNNRNKNFRYTPYDVEEDFTGRRRLDNSYFDSPVEGNREREIINPNGARFRENLSLRQTSGIGVQQCKDKKSFIDFSSLNSIGKQLSTYHKKFLPEDVMFYIKSESKKELRLTSDTNGNRQIVKAIYITAEPFINRKISYLDCNRSVKGVKGENVAEVKEDFVNVNGEKLPSILKISLSKKNVTELYNCEQSLEGNFFYIPRMYNRQK